jgi:two-component system nitrogen regulation sensor histidine kinase NtrY
LRVQRRLAAYLLGVHALFALLAASILLAPRAVTGNRWWVVGAEVVLVGSLVAGARLLRALMAPLETLAQGAQLLQEADLGTRLVPVGRSEVDALVGVYNAMADRLRDERTRGEERHHLLTQLLAASPSAVVFLDLQGRIDFANDAAQRWLGRVKGEKVEALEGAVGRALAALQPGQVEVVVLPGGGRLRCRRGSFMDRGAARAFFQIEELTEELRQAEKAAYEKLIRLMAHEVNNSVGASNSLLNSCLNYASYLPDEHRADFRMALEVVVGRTQQLSTLMRGFAEVVRLPTPQKVPCDLVALVEHVAVLMRQGCKERRIEWRQELEPRPPLVALDRIQMEQVLVNVVKNAMEAIGDSGVITVRLGRRGARLALVVEDSGPGLSGEARRQLFTPFFTTKEQGQGIGLTLVQQILGAHHFDFALESPPTRFTILF